MYSEFDKEHGYWTSALHIYHFKSLKCHELSLIDTHRLSNKMTHCCLTANLVSKTCLVLRIIPLYILFQMKKMQKA